MQKYKSLENSPDWFTPKQSHSSKLTRKLKQNGTEDLLITTFHGRKLRNLGKSQYLNEDLHQIFTPIVGLLRGQCGYIDIPRVIVFKPSDQISKRRSQDFSQLDMILLQDKSSQGQNSFPEHVMSLKEAKLTERFLFDIRSMIIERGLGLSGSPDFSFLRNQDLNMWFSYLSLTSCQDTTNILDESSLIPLMQKDNYAGKWIRSIFDLLKKYPTPQQDILPTKTFQVLVP
eukprot:TRINITY_DN18355_c0_g1_i1.p1 TRINITY_DN18355_c0_g1~~TRINITY_DN18355_c0_g1_i1.p1  ORF type:complete len:230 (-),score=16.18 TRINITY_DN18355_c0_g1_i1:151-840(-)